MQEPVSKITITELLPSAGPLRYIATLLIQEWHPTGNGRVLYSSEYCGRTAEAARDEAQREGKKVLERLPRR